MVQVYIRPQAYQGISFDLDDTLYDNAPIIRAAEASLLQFLHQTYRETRRWQRDDWISLKTSLIQNQPDLAHDTTAARLSMLEQGLLMLGYSTEDAEVGAVAGLNHFLHKRSDFRVSRPVINLLRDLSLKYPLIGITNGNVDADKIGLGDVLSFVLHPGKGTRMKPYADMFNIACRRLDIPLASLLHVGDSHGSDVMGARMAGCQSVWLNPSFGRDKTLRFGRLLPHVEIENIHELQGLLG
ncbi:HAD-IA family hydrolase [Shewanella violacea]|uniref:HAD-superfamily hydrolase, subfamily IA, variant 1 family protein n=1 Tax=Shewanella violacea (strain JCM 10179 / CIP 106290 / LMG 19151 / DSS12) TaxID=637905 RepID=D4ZCR0_SHEVD|nr:HAD-IA family hydrolase [Shewanella violacea]BAJ03805.1 HAD-superfamily hydrolase, subfamily IA, variant 1 family protein [Shewanella violacea DSS12]